MEKTYSLLQFLDVTGKSMSKAKYFKVEEKYPGKHSLSDWMCILSTEA